MKTFKEWLKLKEGDAIVSKKDCHNKNFQVLGAFCDNKKSVSRRRSR